ncbi:hypothetical protein GCM10008904_14400 [Paraclostridium ghonii]|uniref:Uncharacterized protein n=1 Tax=Paraclostridium ghonii TaxID=29358 RepID=A0ABU0MZW4_9FIRM|nr:hypothetical protein [Paeniclostridium ghonii]MDQ0556443.1 hypothetical protein [Paeniclostridium ghonii]
MENKKVDTNNIEMITYTVIGGVLTAYFIPTYIPIVLLGGGAIGSIYGIIKILDKYKSIEDINFVSKEHVKYFSKEE